MKKYRASIGAKVVAWILCLGGLTAGVLCGGQASWLAARGAYQSMSDGSLRLQKEGQQEILQEQLDNIVYAYQRYRQEDLGAIPLDGGQTDKNVFYTIKNPQKVTLYASPEQGEYREKAVWEGTVQEPDTEEYIQKDYNSLEAQERALEELYETYDVVDEVVAEQVYDDGAVANESGEVTGTGYQERYRLSARCVQYGEEERVEITAYLRAELVPAGEIYSRLTYLEQMGTYRYELAVAAVAGLVLGGLGLLFLALSAGYGPRNPEKAETCALDRWLPADLTVVVGLLILPIWLAYLPVGAAVQTVIPLGGVLLCLLCLAVLVTGLLSILRKKRTGTWKDHLLWERIGKPVKGWVRKLWDLLKGWARKLRGLVGQGAAQLPIIWQALVYFLVLCLLEGLCLVGIRTGNGVAVLWVLLKVVEGLLLLWVVLSVQKLREGAEKLAAGKLDYQLPLDKLYGPFRAHGEDLNNIRQGIRHAVEEQMKSERMKTELITNVSHDIKTPLTSIVSYVDLLKKEPMPNDEAREYLDVLDRQSARLKKLTEDLVEASKASTGNLTVDLQPTDVNVLLTQCAGEYQEKLAAQQLDLVLTPDPDGPRISADGRLLWRVFENLLSNIIKYAMPGTRVYLTCTATEETVSIVFRNISANPLNISAEELMERFVRGDSARNTEGSGLGLSIARSLTQLQGGDFSLTIDGDLFKAGLTFPRGSA